MSALSSPLPIRSQTAQELSAPSAQAARQPATDAAVRLTLPASPIAARQARTAIRQAVTSWGVTALSGDAELIGSELVANAAEHGGGQPITIAVHRHVTPGGRLGICCEVSDSSPALPQRRPVQPDNERGRGLAIVAALATDSGVTARPGGKTGWFTLTASHPAARRDRALRARGGHIAFHHDAQLPGVCRSPVQVAQARVLRVTMTCRPASQQLPDFRGEPMSSSLRRARPSLLRQHACLRFGHDFADGEVTAIAATLVPPNGSAVPRICTGR